MSTSESNFDSHDYKAYRAFDNCSLYLFSEKNTFKHLILVPDGLFVVKLLA